MDESITTTVDSVGNMAKFISDYGFMIVFCAVILIFIAVFLWKFTDHISKKSNTELDLASKEREASLDQNKRMFDLVTTVQTEQVSQLQMMTDSLKTMNASLSSSGTHLDHLEVNFSKMEEDVSSIRKEHSNISDILDDILRCVKESSKYNVEILKKVRSLETALSEAKKAEASKTTTKRTRSKKVVEEPIDALTEDNTETE